MRRPGALRRLAGIDRRVRTDYFDERVAKLEACGWDVATCSARRLAATSWPHLPATPRRTSSSPTSASSSAREGRRGASKRSRPPLLVPMRPTRKRAFEPGRGGSPASSAPREAIELYWRAFDKTNELDGKLGGSRG